MKSQLFLTLVLITSSFTVSLATVRTVNNSNPSPGQYLTFGAAVTAAVNNDTLYISGSATSYGYGTLNKVLTIIGTGHNPDKQNPLVSSFNAIYMTPGSVGSRIIGLTFTNPSVISFAGGTLTYESCLFNGFFNAVECSTSGIIVNFRKCVLLGPGVKITPAASSASAIFNNCTFNAWVNDYTIAGVALSGSANNCLFNGSAQYVGGNLTNFTYSNSIFYGSNPQLTGTNSNVLFQNNISYNCIVNAFGGQANINNLVNVNPLLVSYPPPTGFKYTDDYHLQPASPAKNYGTDGKDLGIYGGTDPYFHMGGEPAIPQIRQMNLNATTVPAGQSVTGTIISTIKP